MRKLPARSMERKRKGLSEFGTPSKGPWLAINVPTVLCVVGIAKLLGLLISSDVL